MHKTSDVHPLWYIFFYVDWIHTLLSTILYLIRIRVLAKFQTMPSKIHNFIAHQMRKKPNNILYTTIKTMLKKKKNLIK